MSASAAEPTADVASFLEDWLTQSPEMDVALVFTGTGRQRSQLWGAVLNQWLGAIFSPSDTSVALAKLSWWAQAIVEESEPSAHPLVAAFLRQCVPAIGVAHWQGLHDAAAQLAALDASPGDIDAMIASRLPVARAIVEIEQALWPQAGAGDAVAVARSLVLWQWRWCVHAEGTRVALVPLQLLARHGVRLNEAFVDPVERSAPVRAVWQDLAGTLLSVPAAIHGPRLRRIRTRLDVLSLKRLHSGHAQPFPASGLDVLWQCWQGGRGTPA